MPAKELRNNFEKKHAWFFCPRKPKLNIWTDLGFVSLDIALLNADVAYILSRVCLYLKWHNKWFVRSHDETS